MKNKILAITRDTIPYVKHLREIPEVKSCAAAILMQQLDYWFSKSKKDRFFKFLSPCDHPKYSEGDSWTEELGFSEDEFRTAFDCLGVRYKSMKEVSEVQKNGQDAFQNMFYLSYTNRIEACTYYMRNNDLVDSILDNLMAGTIESLYETKVTQIGKVKTRKQARPIYVNGESQDTEVGTTKTDSIITENTTETTRENLSLETEKQEQQQEPNLPLEHQKESHPPVPLTPPPLKNKGKKDRASIAIPTSLNNADFLAEWEKLLQTKKWKGKEDSTLEGILEKLSTFDVRFATELANQARLNEWQGIIFAQTGKNYEMWLKSNAQSNNSPETVQLSVLANSGLKTLKIARKCKAYEIAERLVDKQTGVILNEAISQEDKAYIAWITKNITNHINNNTIDKQEWFCGFVVRKQ